MAVKKEQVTNQFNGTVKRKDIFDMKDVWWKSAKGNCWSNLFSIMKFMEEQQRHHATNNLINFRLYGNANVAGFGSTSYAKPDNGPENRVTLNICQSVADTVCSKLGTQTPKATFLTKNGDYDLQRKAKKLDQFVQGQMYHTDFDDLRPQIFLDATVLGTGCVKIFPQQGKVRAERVVIDNIKVDDVDGMYGNPRNLYDERYVSREILLGLYPKHKDAIKNADAPQFNNRFTPLNANYYELYNQIKVVEAFHLPSSEGAKDGRHVICIGGVDLVDEAWNQDTFPYAFFRWSPRLLGFYGQGIVEQVRGIQLEMNKLLRTYQTSIHLCAIPYVLQEMGSKISSSLLNNEVGRITKYSGTPPQVVAPQAVPPDLFQAINWYYQRAYEIIGVSMMNAQAVKPSGLDAAVAMREYNDIASERFLTVGKRWEKFVVDAAKLYVTAAKEIAESDPGFSTCCVNKKFIEEIKWKEINLDESDYVLQVFPTSSLPSTPAGKLQTVQEMLQAGLIPPEVGASLLQFPDLEAYNSIAQAPQDDFQFCIDKIIEDGNYIGPEPYQSPYMPLGLQMFGGAYLRAKTSGVKEERLGMMRQWINAAMQQMQPPAPPLPEGIPQANAAPPPVSDLVPNAPGIPPAGMPQLQ
jgi:hypothetical protein